MAKSDDASSGNAAGPTQIPPAGTGTGTVDVENHTTGTVTNILRRWRREDLVEKGSLGLRGFAFLCSLIAFLITATNTHGDGQNFDQYEEYRYLLAIAILSTLYTGLQCLRQGHELSTGRKMFNRQNLAMLDFFGDQVTTYLLLSAASSAVPQTNRMRVAADNIFTDSSASAISMEFLAFFALAISALISGYKLTTQTYI